MKKLIFLIIFIPFLACNKDNDTDSKNGKYFDSINLDKLNLANIDNFWREGIDIDTSFYMGNFERNTEFIEGIKLYANNGKAIWISIFKTKKDAISAMELRINDAACIIKNGDPDEFENQWWYSDCVDYKIFFNQHNTIVELDIASTATLWVIKKIFLEVAGEISERIDKLSD